MNCSWFSVFPYIYKYAHGGEYDAGIQDISKTYDYTGIAVNCTSLQLLNVIILPTHYYRDSVKDSSHCACFVRPCFNSKCDTHAEEIKQLHSQINLAKCPTFLMSTLQSIANV